MKQKLYLTAAFALVALFGSFLLACDSANPVAPPGTVLTVSANPTQIPLNGTSNIIVTGFRPDGNPLNPGTQVNLSTSLGVLGAGVVEIDSAGQARTTLSADGRTGMATVTASTVTGGDSMATVDVQIGETDETRPQLLISAMPSTIGLNSQSTITVLVRNADNSPIGAGGQVTVRTTLGRLQQSTIVTNTAGEARTTLFSENVPGEAMVTATFGASMEAMTTVTIEERAPNLIISANPSTIPILESSRITIIARDSFNNPLGAGERIRLIPELGSIQEEVFTNSNGEATATFTAGDQSGTGVVRAFLRNSEAASVEITIRDAAASITLTGSANSVQRSTPSTMIMFEARVRNSQSLPVGGIIVQFVSPVGSFNPPSGSVPTNSQGVAQATLTVTSEQLAGVGNSFEVTATVSSEGDELEDTWTITVLGSAPSP